jgi:hypothetical protein
MILKIFSPKNLEKNVGGFAKKISAGFCKTNLTMVFEENAIFCRKLAKIAENCDHNIDKAKW